MPAVLFPKPVEIPETLRQGGRYKWWFHFFFAEAIISRGCNNMAHWVSNPVKRVQCFGYFAFFLAVPHFAGSYFGLQSGEDTRSENRKSLKYFFKSNPHCFRFAGGKGHLLKLEGSFDFGQLWLPVLKVCFFIYFDAWYAFTKFSVSYIQLM